MIAANVTLKYTQNVWMYWKMFLLIMWIMVNTIKKSAYDKMSKSFKNAWEIDIYHKIIKNKQKHMKK